MGKWGIKEGPPSSYNIRTRVVYRFGNRKGIVNHKRPGKIWHLIEENQKSFGISIAASEQAEGKRPRLMAERLAQEKGKGAFFGCRQSKLRRDAETAKNSTENEK